jgi:hypothetical protein
MPPGTEDICNYVEQTVADSRRSAARCLVGSRLLTMKSSVLKMLRQKDTACNMHGRGRVLAGFWYENLKKRALGRPRLR